MTTISETEDSLKRIQNHAGVQGVIVVNAEGKFNCLHQTQWPEIKGRGPSKDPSHSES